VRSESGEERLGSVIINVSTSQDRAFASDGVLTVALLDRILHHSTIVNIRAGVIAPISMRLFVVSLRSLPLIFRMVSSGWRSGGGNGMREDWACLAAGSAITILDELRGER
jgi:hypothetical protein